MSVHRSVKVQDRSWRQPTSFLLACASGPVCYLVGNEIPGMIYAAAATYIILCFIFVIPLVVLTANRQKALIWQISVISFVLSVLVDDFLIGTLHRREVAMVTFMFWSIGTLVSSPVPVFLILRPLPKRKRWIVGLMLAIAGVALWFGFDKITGGAHW